MIRTDGVWFDAKDVEWLVAVLNMLTVTADRAGFTVPSSIPPVHQALQGFLDGRAGGSGGATTEPVVLALPDSDGQWIDAEEVARMLDVTVDAVRKSCRQGRFAIVARKHRGRWWIPADSVTEVS